MQAARRSAENRTGGPGLYRSAILSCRGGIDKFNRKTVAKFVLPARMSPAYPSAWSTATMANEESFDPYADHCIVRIRVYLKVDGRVGRIDGPETEGENGCLKVRSAPGNDFKLTSVYGVMGSFIPYFPPSLNGQAGVDRWLDGLKARGFQLKKLL